MRLRCVSPNTLWILFGWITREREEMQPANGNGGKPINYWVNLGGSRILLFFFHLRGQLSFFTDEIIKKRAMWCTCSRRADRTGLFVQFHPWCCKSLGQTLKLDNSRVTISYVILQISTCHSNLVRRKPRQPALPVSQPEGQNGVVVFGVMEGEAMGGGGGGTSTQRDGHSKPHRNFPLWFPLEQRACRERRAGWRSIAARFDFREQTPSSRPASDA